MFSFLVAVTVSAVSFTESRIVWEMDLWACLRGVSLVVLILEDPSYLEVTSFPGQGF